MYIAHIHYSDAIVFTVSYQKQEMDSCSRTLISPMEPTMSFVCVCNEQMMLKLTNCAKLTLNHIYDLLKEDKSMSYVLHFIEL